MRNLTSLAAKYRCDKLFRHSYIPIYEDLLKDIIVTNLLEIGIGYKDLMEPFIHGYIDGASIYMWSEYFPDANIWAADIQPEILINSGNIKSFLCDQSSPEQLIEMAESIGRKLDVIIDDGSHQTEHQILTADTLLPYLACDGVYVIEDVQNTSMILDIFGGRLIKGGKTPDDNLIILRK